MNTNVNKYSRVCSAYFEGYKKQGKDAVLTIFACSKEASATRALPKARSTPVPVTTCHSIGITTFMPPENHVSTCTKDLIICTTMDKEIMVKPAIISVGYNTEIRIYCVVGTNTERVVKNDKILHWISIIPASNGLFSVFRFCCIQPFIRRSH